MKIFSLLAIGSLAAVASAQSTISTTNPAPSTWLLSASYGTAGGATFIDLDVQAAGGITLREFTMDTASNSTLGSYEVWARTGTHAGFEGSMTGWTMIGTSTFTVDTAGRGTGCIQPTSPNSTELPVGVTGLAFVHLDHSASCMGVTTYPDPIQPWGIAGEAQMSNGALIGGAWSGGSALGAALGCVGWIPNMELTYDLGAQPHGCSTITYEGKGSNLHTASAFFYYDDYSSATPAADASGELQGTVLSFVPNGSGYDMSQGPIGGAASWIPGTGAELPVSLNDDEEVALDLTVPLQYTDNNGPQITLGGLNGAGVVAVHTNGIIGFGGTIAGSMPLYPSNPQGSLQGDPTTFFFNRDFDASSAGSIWWEENFGASKTIFTWEGVPMWNTTGPNEVQVQIDHATGQIDFVFQLVDALGGSGYISADNTLLGYSPGGASPETEESDYLALASTTEVLTVPEVLPLTLVATGTPKIGQVFNLDTINAPANSLGLNLLDTAWFTPPVDLSVFGSPAGAVTYMDIASPTVVLNPISNIPGAPWTMSLALPVANVPGLVGLQIASQSFILDLAAPGFPFQNLISSNVMFAQVGYW